MIWLLVDTCRTLLPVSFAIRRLLVLIVTLLGLFFAIGNAETAVRVLPGVNGLT